MSAATGFGGWLWTLGAFLTPVALAPGPFTILHLAGIVYALWMAHGAAQAHVSAEDGSTLPYRVGLVGPAIVATAFFCFVGPLLAAYGYGEELMRLWLFPGSPVALYLTPIGTIPAGDEAVGRLLACGLTAALLCAAIFGLLALVGRIDDPDHDLRRHALRWKGVRLRDPKRELDARGARGLQPLRDTFSQEATTPVVGRLLMRAGVLFLPLVTLPYVPLLARIVAAREAETVGRFLVSPLFDSPFFLVWLTGLWGTLIAATPILSAAYLRIGLRLARKR